MAVASSPPCKCQLSTTAALFCVVHKYLDRSTSPNLAIRAVRNRTCPLYKAEGCHWQHLVDNMTGESTMTICSHTANRLQPTPVAFNRFLQWFLCLLDADKQRLNEYSPQR